MDKLRVLTYAANDTLPVQLDYHSWTKINMILHRLHPPHKVTQRSSATVSEGAPVYGKIKFS